MSCRATSPPLPSRPQLLAHALFESRCAYLGRGPRAGRTDWWQEGDAGSGSCPPGADWHSRVRLGRPMRPTSRRPRDAASGKKTSEKQTFPWSLGAKMNGFPSWAVTRPLMAEPHVPAAGGGVTAGRISEGRRPGGPLAGPSASPDGAPQSSGGRIGVSGKEVGDWNPGVLVTRACEAPRLG